jgi:hypothetical protein
VVEDLKEKDEVKKIKWETFNFFKEKQGKERCRKKRQKEGRQRFR